MGIFIEWTQLRENISKLEDMTMDTSKTEKQREKISLKKAGRIYENCETYYIHNTEEERNINNND